MTSKTVGKLIKEDKKEQLTKAHSVLTQIGVSIKKIAI